NKFSLIVFSTLLLTGLQSLRLNSVTFGESVVVAQTPDARKAEADRLFQQGIEQFQTSQFEAALKSWSRALVIYREIKDRQGEGTVLGNLGLAYYVSIFEQQARTYGTLQQVLITQNKTSLALEISERGRSRAFVELLTSRLVHKTTGQTLEPTVVKPTLSLLQQIAKQQNATLVEYSINYDDFKIQGNSDLAPSQ
ncbi:MAG: hypothetical protein PUP92_05260, partial [Rhizonema sp. PD38]|nr:hypothetical protein [Rhizonema sp. PD38]